MYRKKKSERYVSGTKVALYTMLWLSTYWPIRHRLYLLHTENCQAFSENVMCRGAFQVRRCYSIKMLH